MVEIMEAFIQVGCLMLKVDLHSVSWLMSLQRWLVIQEDTSSFRYVTTMLRTLLLLLQPFYCYYNLCLGLPRWASTRRNIHPLTYPDDHPTFISFFHLLRSIASSLFKLRAWQSFCTTSLRTLSDCNHLQCMTELLGAAVVIDRIIWVAVSGGQVDAAAKSLVRHAGPGT